jgi:hypothetical protein
VNDPPTAIVPDPYYVHEGTSEEPIALRLSGLDVDLGDGVQAIEITVPPSLGYLYLSVSTFRTEDNLLHGTLLSSIDNIIPGEEAYVEYRFTGYSEVIVQGTSVVDFFRFRVKDKMGAWSDEVEAEIRIISNLFPVIEGTPWTIPSSDYNTPCQIRWTDHALVNRTSGVFFESITSKGELIGSEDTLVKENTIISLSSGISDENNVSVTYRVSSNDCIKEGDDFYITDSFTYRIVSLDEDGQLTSTSELVEKQIRVQCSVKPIALKVHDKSLNILAFGHRFDHPCSGYVFNFTAQSKQLCLDVAIVPNITVEGHGSQPESLFLTISSRDGLLSLNTELLDDVQPIYDQEQMRNKIRLLVPPNRVSAILSSILFQSEVEGRDEIHIVVEYGRCNHKVSTLLEQNFSESGPECYKEEIIIPVDVAGNDDYPDELLFREFPWIPLPFALCMLIFLKLRGKSREIMAKHNLEESRRQEEVTCDLTSEQSRDVRWQQHYDTDSGFYYYQNLEDGEVTWDPPLGEQFIPSAEGHKSTRMEESSETADQ